MKEKLRRYWALMLVFIMVSSVCFMFSCRKEGMFIDEIYTYGLSNSSFAPFLADIKGGSMNGTVFTREELLDYVIVTGEEGFDFSSVYYNQVHDVHPPLYYWLFNIVSSVSRGGFSKWTGLVLDYVIYMLSLLVLYKLVIRLGGSTFNACAAAVLYGLSVIGLSTMLMIRMYVLLTLLTLVLVWLIACLMREFRPKYCVLIGLTLLAGLMTQYYFVFYAFFLCAAYVIYALIKRQYKALAWFIPCALAGALSLLILFPACLDHLFSGALVSGDSAMDNLKNFAQYPARLRTFIGAAVHGLKASIYTALAAVIALVLLFKKVISAGKEHRLCMDWFVFIIPAVVTFVLVAVISPVDEARYIYNLIPVFVLTVSFLLYLLEESAGDFGNKEKITALVFLCIAALALWEARCAPPDYLYPEYDEYDALAAEHAHEPCVYFTDNYSAPMTQDFLQLIIFDDVYVTDTKSLDGMLDYIGDSDEAVVYIDISEFWSSGYDADEVLAGISAASDYDSAALLYQNGLSATYVISK